KEVGSSRPSNLGKTRPYPLESIMNLAWISLFPFSPETVVMESLPSNSTLSTVVSNSTSTPCSANKSVKVLSNSALGNCHVQSQPSENFWLKSKLHTSSPLKNLAPNFFSKFFLSTPSINPASSKCSIHLGIRLSPITNLGNFC